jgi:hypothetical protein
VIRLKACSLVFRFSSFSGSAQFLASLLAWVCCQRLVIRHNRFYCIGHQGKWQAMIGQEYAMNA